jgi:RecB family exonuclease
MELGKGPLVDYLSPSAMSAYLNDPMYFKMRYILKHYDYAKSATAAVGSAGHKALERLYTGSSVEEAITAGQKELDNIPDNGIKYNSTIDCREKLVMAYIKAINMFIEELPEFHKIISVEERITTELESVVAKGKNLPLPGKMQLDLLVANEKNELEIIDYKFVYNYTDPDKDDFKRWLQGMFYKYGVKARYGVMPARIKYMECKTSRNRDGSRQIKDWTLEFNDERDDFVFERLYNDVVLDMNNPGRLFLPNPQDMFNGQEMFEIYRQSLDNDELSSPAAAPVAVKHRTQQTDFVEKQFVPSAGSSAETAAYTPEERIRSKLNEFGVIVEMRDTIVGASVTKYTMEPSRYTRVSRIKQHISDLSLVLRAESIRIEAPIPGTNLIGVEVPNKERRRIDLEDGHFKPGTLEIPVGANVSGEIVHADLVDMPHLLIAGQTGSGKSVMLNVIIRSLTNQMNPEQLGLILIDPKQVELSAYESLPHLECDIITDYKSAIHALDELVKEMETRYKRLRRGGCRTIDEYNSTRRRTPMKKIVTIIDEFADLMMTAETANVGSMDIKRFNENLLNILDDSKTGRLTQKATKEAIRRTLEDDDAPDAEHSIIRIAQKARAVGIHLILATQRPSADVVTGLIKANIPTKIAFATTSGINSKIILDVTGAEELTGKGDMLFMPTSGEMQRLQGLYA